jgi:hypothetical protein
MVLEVLSGCVRRERGAGGIPFFRVRCGGLLSCSAMSCSRESRFFDALFVILPRFSP